MPITDPGQDMTVKECLILGDTFTPARLFEKALEERFAQDGLTLSFRSIDIESSELTAFRSDEVSEAFGDATEIAREMANCRFLVTTFAPVTEAMLEQARSLIAICCGRGGPVNINLEAASKRGIPVLHAPGRNEQAVAEFVIAGMINLMRRIPHALDWVRDGAWTTPLEDTFEKPSGPELCGRTLGLVGAGRIGCLVSRLARAFGARVLASDPFADAASAAASGIELVTLDHLLAECDIISVHARLPGDAAPLLGKAEFAAMARRPYVLNTARAATLDYDALVGALQGGQITAALLDVYPDEPLAPTSPLLSVGKDRLLLTPHAAGISRDVPANTARMLADGLARLLKGERPPHVANREALETCLGRLGFTDEG